MGRTTRLRLNEDAHNANSADALGEVGQRTSAQYAPVTKVGDAAAVAYIWTRAFIADRGWQRAAGWLAFPSMWVVYFCIASAVPVSCLRWRTAAAFVPHRASRGRPLWGGVVLVLAGLVIGEQVVESSLSSAWWLPTLVLLIVLGGGFLANVADLAMRTLDGGDLKKSEPLLAAMTGGPVVKAGLLASWPPRTGAGSELLAAVVKEGAQQGISGLVLARDESLADWYVRRHDGVRINPEFPRHIAWPAVKATCVE